MIVRCPSLPSGRRVNFADTDSRSCLNPTNSSGRTVRLTTRPLMGSTVRHASTNEFPEPHESQLLTSRGDHRVKQFEIALDRPHSGLPTLGFLALPLLRTHRHKLRCPTLRITDCAIRVQMRRSLPFGRECRSWWGMHVCPESMWRLGTGGLVRRLLIESRPFANSIFRVIPWGLGSSCSVQTTACSCDSALH